MNFANLTGRLAHPDVIWGAHHNKPDLKSTRVISLCLWGAQIRLDYTKLIGYSTSNITGEEGIIGISYCWGRIRKRLYLNIKALDVLFGFIRHLIFMNSLFCIIFKLKLPITVKSGPKPNPSFSKCVLRIETHVKTSCSGSCGVRLRIGLWLFFWGLEIVKCVQNKWTIRFSEVSTLKPP